MAASRTPRTPATRIVVFRALPGLGDFLCLVPALRALRAARPAAEIHLVGLESNRPLASRFDRYVDRFHAFPGHPALPEQPSPPERQLDTFMAGIRRLRAAMALQLHGSGEETNAIVERLGAVVTAGFDRPGRPHPAGGRFLPWHEGEPEPRRPLRLLRALGIPAEDDRLEFPLDPTAHRRATDLLGSVAGGSYVVVHPGGSRPEARWGTAGFAAVTRRLVASGLRVVLTGSRPEAHLTAPLAAVPGVLDLAGRTDLDELGWLLRGARLVIANDTGVSHLAAALAVPSVVVFADASASHRRRWAPLDARLHHAVPGRVADVLRESGGLIGSLELAA